MKKDKNQIIETRTYHKYTFEKLSHQMVSWCSRLSHVSHTHGVLSSSLSETILFDLLFCFSLEQLHERGCLWQQTLSHGRLCHIAISHTTTTTRHVIVHEQRNKEEGERVSEGKGVAHLCSFLKSHKTTQNVLRLETIARLSQHLFGNCVDGTLPGYTLTEAHKFDCELKNTLSLQPCAHCDE